jgi:hypothetical protein
MPRAVKVTCSDCTKTFLPAHGKVAGGDGLFHCVDCWNALEPPEFDGDDAFIVMDPATAVTCPC